MPTATPKACDGGGCRNLALPGSDYCALHQAAARKDDNARDRARYARNPWRAWYSKSAWKRLVIWKKNRNPLCEACGRNPTEVIHHKKDHRGDWNLFIDQNNLQGLCKTCHDLIPKIGSTRQPGALAATGAEGKQFTSSSDAAALDKALEGIDDLDLDNVRIPGIAPRNE
jgi:5-methylcytosine-specific restriction enzyme A